MSFGRSIDFCRHCTVGHVDESLLRLHQIIANLRQIRKALLAKVRPCIVKIRGGQKPFSRRHQSRTLQRALFAKRTHRPAMQQLTLQIDRPIFHLHENRIQSIAAIREFDNLADRIADGTIVMDDQILQTFHQSALQITGFRRFHGRIDETLTASHRVEEELGGRQTREETVLNEATGRRNGR